MTLPQFPSASHRRSLLSKQRATRGFRKSTSIKKQDLQSGEIPTLVSSTNFNDFIGLELDIKFQDVLGKTSDPVLAKNLANLSIPVRSFLLSDKGNVWGKKGGGVVPPQFSYIREQSKTKLGNPPWANALNYTRMCRLGDEADKIIPRDRAYCSGTDLRNEDMCRAWCRGLIALRDPVITRRYRKYFGKTSLASFHLLDSAPLRVLRVIVSRCIMGHNKFINLFSIPKRSVRMDPLLYITTLKFGEQRIRNRSDYWKEREADIVDLQESVIVDDAVSLIPHIIQGFAGLDRLMLD